MQKADPPAFSFPGMKVPKNLNLGANKLPAVPSPREEFLVMDISNATIRAGFASLDEVDLEGIFLVRAS